MARSKRPALEMAVASNAVLSLPLEIRIMVYTQLLHGAAEILMASARSAVDTKGDPLW